MIQYAVFDLDGTLAPYDAATDRADIALLKEIENKGVQIVICSGKPVFYSCGFLRQTGLKEPIIIGENGAEMQFGYKLPPSFFYHMPYSEQAKESLHFFYKQIKEAIPDMWFQPNMVELSPFPKSREEFRIIDDIIQNNREHIQDIHIFKYFDCYDFIPMNINKGEAFIKSPQSETSSFLMFNFANNTLDDIYENLSSVWISKLEENIFVFKICVPNDVFASFKVDFN